MTDEQISPQPVTEIPPMARRRRARKYDEALQTVKAQPGVPFELAVFKAKSGAGTVRQQLRKQSSNEGFKFEARTINAVERGGPENEAWSVLYAIYNG